MIWYWLHNFTLILILWMFCNVCLPPVQVFPLQKRICHQWVHQFFHYHLWGHGNHLSFFTGPRIPTRSRPRSTQEIDAGIKNPPGKEGPKNVPAAKHLEMMKCLFFGHQITTCSCLVAKKCAGSNKVYFWNVGASFGCHPAFEAQVGILLPIITNRGKTCEERWER